MLLIKNKLCHQKAPGLSLNLVPGAIVRCMDLTLDDYLNLKKWEISHFLFLKTSNQMKNYKY